MSDLESIQREWIYFFRTNQKSASVGSIWESFKQHARMILSSRINRHKASYKIVLQQAEECPSTLEQVFITDPSAANASLVRLQSRLTDQLYFEKAKWNLFFSKQCIFEHDEHAGKLLAYMAHLDHRPPVVVMLPSASGDMITDPSKVADEFRGFYSDLYTSTACHSQDKLTAFLQDIDFPTLTHPHPLPD